MPMKRGAHYNNDCNMLTNLADIEVTTDVAVSRGFNKVGSLNPNLVPTKENEASSFFDNVLKHSPCILSLSFFYSILIFVSPIVMHNIILRMSQRK